MKNILCYGDSNTYGFDAATNGRFPWGVRWTSVVQKRLGEDFRVIEEGLGGRTTVWEDPVENRMSGREYLLPCLGSHWPLDLMVLMLGTNDLKARFGLEAFDIAAGAENLVCMAKDFFRKVGKDTPILVLSPIEVAEEIETLPFCDILGGSSAVRRSRDFPRYFRQMAERNGCEFLDASDYAKPCSLDGLHLDAESHQRLGEAVAAKIAEICSDHKK